MKPSWQTLSRLNLDIYSNECITQVTIKSNELTDGAKISFVYVIPIIGLDFGVLHVMQINLILGNLVSQVFEHLYNFH